MRDDYLGKMLEEEHLLVLVPVDPERPWAAFRKMRALMKRGRPGIERFPTEAASPVASEEADGAEVIPLRRKVAGR